MSRPDPLLPTLAGCVRIERTVTEPKAAYCTRCGSGLSAEWQTAGRRQRSSWDPARSTLPLFYLGLNASWVTTQSEQYSPIPHATLHIGSGDYTACGRPACDSIQLGLVQTETRFGLWRYGAESGARSPQRPAEVVYVLYIQSSIHEALSHTALACQEHKSLHFPAD